MMSVSLASCAAVDRDDSSTRAEAVDLFALISSRASAGASIWQPTSIVEVLPNQPLKFGDEVARPMSSLLVVGTPTAVELERTYRHDDFAEGGPKSVEVETDDPRSAWRAYRVSVDVRTSSAGSDVGRSFDFGITFGTKASPKAVESEILSLGEVFVIADAPGFFDFDRELHGVLLSGAGLGTVDGGARVSFPAMSEIAPDFVKGHESVDAILKESERVKPAMTIDING